MTESNTIDSSPTTQQQMHPEQENADECSTNGEKFEKDDAEAARASASTPNNDSDLDAEETIEMLGKLPAEFGMLLILSGIAGVLLPGPIGMPLLIAGGVTMWPKTFDPIERWFSRKFPIVHREGVFQIKEFISDLQRRFPDTK